jgi:hypothetical protein
MGGSPTGNRCSEGIGEGRELHAPRAPPLLFIRASTHLIQASIYACIRRVGGCVRVRMRARVCEGGCREGKQEVRRDEGMGEADGVNAGYSWRASALVLACACVCACLRMYVRAFVCKRACVCVFACVCLFKPLRGPSRCMQPVDHHGLFQST